MDHLILYMHYIIHDNLQIIRIFQLNQDINDELYLMDSLIMDDQLKMLDF